MNRQELESVIRQNLKAEIENDSRRVLNKITQILKEKLISTANAWTEQGCSLVLPDRCKYFVKVGDNTRIVLEYKPQVRTLFFSESFVKATSLVQDRYPDIKTPVLLSLPYVIFVIFFHKNMFNGMCLTYRNQPLATLDDMLYTSNLPNVNQIARVCLGNAWNERYICSLSSKAIKEQIDILMNDFWQSCFNQDYSEHYWEYIKINGLSLSILEWSKKTIVDPGFITKVNWAGYTTLRNLLFNNISRGENAVGPNFSNDVEEVIKKLTETVDKWIENACKNLNVRTDSSSLEEERWMLLQEIDRLKRKNYW